MDLTTLVIFILCYASTTEGVVFQPTLDPLAPATDAKTSPLSLALDHVGPALRTPLRKTRVKPLVLMAAAGSMAEQNRTIPLDKRFDHLTSTIDKLIENLTYDREWQHHRDFERRQNLNNFGDQLIQHVGQQFKNTLKTAADRSRQHDNSLWQMYSRLAKFEKLYLTKNQSTSGAERILVQKQLPTRHLPALQEQEPEPGRIQPSGEGEMEWVPTQDIPTRKHARHHPHRKLATMAPEESTPTSDPWQADQVQSSSKKHEHFSSDFWSGNEKWKINAAKKEKEKVARHRERRLKRQARRKQSQDDKETDSYEAEAST